MKKINFVFLGYINAPNGAATFFKTIIENKRSISKSKNIFFYYQKDKEVKEIKSQLKKPKTFRRNVQQIGNLNPLFSLIVFYLFALRHAKRVIKNLGNIEKNDQWVFNDIFTAFYFFKKKPDFLNCYLILHNNGDPTRMIYQTYLKLENSFFSKKIEKEAKKIIENVKKIIVLSDDSKKVLIKKYPDLKIEKKIEVVENGSELVEVSRKRSNAGLTGVSVGSISYRKGFDMLVKACNNLNKDTLQINCIGNIQDQEIVNNSKISLNFLGPKTREEIPQYLADADFYILCSRDEGMPISIIEAMQYKLPIFSTKVGSIPRMILDNKEGKLMNASVEDIEENLYGLIKGKYPIKEMGSKAYETYIERFSVKKMIKEYKRILND